MKSIIILEPSQVLREALTQSLSTAPGFYIKAVFANPQALLAQLPGLMPTHTLMVGLNFHPPKSQIPDWLTEFLISHPTLPVLVHSLHHTPTFIQNLVTSGVNGFLLKDCSRELLLQAVQKLLQGGYYYQQGPWKQMQAILHASKATTDTLPNLTAIERKLLLMALAQIEAPVVIRELKLTPIRFQRHWFQIEQKFGTTDPRRLFQLAVHKGELP